MSVLDTDIKFMKSTTVNDTVGNGGRMGTSQVNDNVINNIFSDIKNTDRLAGVTRYRKVYMKNSKAADNEALLNSEVWISQLSLGDDYMRMKEGTNVDLQSDATGYSSWKGSGIISGEVAAVDTSLDVEYDTADGVNVGDRLMLISGEGTTAETTVTGVSWTGETANISLSGAVGIAFEIGSIAGTIVDLETVQATSGSWNETSSIGTYDESTYPIVMYDAGAVVDSWALTFTSATTFSISGANIGSVGTGDISTNFIPENSDSYYFKLDFRGWGGTWAIGETITFVTVHAAKSFWIKEVVPANISDYKNSSTVIDWRGES